MAKVAILWAFGCFFTPAPIQDERLLEEYETRRLSAPQNVKGQLELAKWCDSHKLREQALKAYERAVEIDPENETARKALGHKKVLGRWTSEKNYQDPSWWAHPKVDQKKVDDAIVKGCEHLFECLGKLPAVGHDVPNLRMDELVMLTLVQAGWDRKDPRFNALLLRVQGLPLDRTYCVALKAMVLAELDPMKYQQQLAQCAQFLVDNQCENGQWGYGKPTAGMPPIFPTTPRGPIENIATGVEGAKDKKLGRVKVGQIEIKKGPPVGEKAGDNSNTQYAALGLRACLSGLVVAPKETVQKALAWWERSQNEDGGWGYWLGGQKGPHGSWGSMTAGGIGSVAILKYYMHRVWNENADWANSPNIKKGCEWIDQNFKLDQNPKHPSNAWVYYWIYAVERAGRLLDTETFGTHEWYLEGANWLLGRQRANGSFEEAFGGKERFQPGTAAETCFAILFLRRATPKLSETIKTGPAK